MNRKTAQILTLAALSSFSVASMAYEIKVRGVEPKVEIKTAPKAIEIVKPSVTPEIKVGGKNLKTDIVVNTKATETAYGQCDDSIYDKAAEGTNVSRDVFKEGVQKGALNIAGSKCGEDFNAMSPDAKEVAALTVQCELAKGIEGVAGLSDRAAIGGECMLGVKKAKGMKDVTIQSETANWMAVHDKCAIFQ